MLIHSYVLVVRPGNQQKNYSIVIGALQRNICYKFIAKLQVLTPNTTYGIQSLMERHTIGELTHSQNKYMNLREQCLLMNRKVIICDK